jgi:IS5 family transposase
VKNKEQRIAKIREANASLAREAKEKAEKKAEAAGGDAAEVRKAGREAAPEPKAQRNFTDAESRIMKGSDGFVQAYNCQAAVDAFSQVIVAQAVTNQANDMKQLKPLLAQVEENTGSNPEELSADAGYCSEDNLEELERRGIRGYVATGRDRHGDARAKGRDGSQRPLRSAMARRLRAGGHQSRYRQRKIVVEPVFGHIKQARGFRQFLLRGLQKVAGEWSLLATAHNLLKLHGWMPQPA